MQIRYYSTSFTRAKAPEFGCDDSSRRRSSVARNLLGSFILLGLLAFGPSEASAQVDFGDAPTSAQSGFAASYPTLLADSGARHTISGPTLGATVDAEADGQPNATATGDGADEDGVTSFTNFVIGQFGTLSVNVSGATGDVYAWIDFNKDGVFATPAERIINGTAFTAGETKILNVNILGTATPGTTFGRFRVVSTGAGDPTPSGLAASGEVEDYAIVITALDFGDAPDPLGATAGKYPTLLIHDGPRHTLVSGGPILGSVIDGEADGAPSSDATGDDTAGDDEDGVAFGGAFVAGTSGTTITATVSVAVGKLNAWIDYNQDGDFLDGGEQIATDLAVGLGANPFSPTVPLTALSGTTFARFRLSSAGGDASTGAAADGEVEDYQITIQHLDYGDAPDTGGGIGIGNYKTLLSDGGASHIIGGPRFGALVDNEADGLQNGTATGDDLVTSDDEDGVTLPAQVGLGTTNTVVIDVQGASGKIDAFIDFDRNGSWADPGEQILTNQAVAVGSNTFSFVTPQTADISGGTFARFRISTAGGLTAIGAAADGEVEDYAITVVGLDYGDAPDGSGGMAQGNYKTVLTDDGARHGAFGPRIGATRDVDDGTLQNATATLDDLTNTGSADDEDGVTVPATITAGQSASISVNVQSVDGRVDAWIDFNRNGDWADSGEQIVTNQAVTAGFTPSYNFTTPLTASVGTTFVRVRVSSAGSLGSTGLAKDGEVEDYAVTIQALDYGDAPDAGLGKSNKNYETLAANGGPSHIITGPILGSLVDADADGQQGDTATGDDTDGTDDEDGVAFSAAFEAGASSATVTVTVSGIGGKLDAWVDWNQDGDFLDANEQIKTNFVVNVGATPFSPAVPITATPGKTYARFRVSTAGGLTPTGASTTGEVEDYRVTVGGTDYGDAPDLTGVTGAGDYQTLSANNGARHTITGLGPVLGALIDADSDGLQNVGATGDDGNNLADEDGIVFTSPLILSVGGTNTASVGVTVSGASGVLDAWIDFDGNGDWSDPGEQVITTKSVSVGSQMVSFTIPAQAFITASSFARFRLSSTGAVAQGYTSLGAATDGEVEDYPASLVNGAAAAAQTVTVPTGGVSPYTISVVAGPKLKIVDTNGTILSKILTTAIAGGVTINGSAGDDTFIIDYTTDPSAFGGLTIDGKGQTTGDKITLQGASPLAFTHTFTSLTSGSFTGTGLGTTTYTGIEPIADNLSVTNRIFTFSGVDETIDLKDDGPPANGLSFINSTAGESVTFVNPTNSITVNGGGGVDQIVVAALDNLYNKPITINGDVGNDIVTVKAMAAGWTNLITVNGNADDDELIADFVNGNAIPATGGLTYTGGTQTTSDKLTLKNGTGLTTITHTFTNANDGTVDVDSRVLTYIGLEPITDNLSSTNRIFTFGATADAITLEEAAAAGDSQSKISSTSSSETVTFTTTPTTTITVNAGGGNDSVRMKKLDSTYAGAVTVNGDAADDTFNADFVGGNPFTTAGVTYHGGSQTTSDFLVLTGGSPTTVDHVYTDAHSGTVTADGVVLTYDTIEPITDELTPTTRTFTFSSAVNTITLKDDGVLADGFSELSTASVTSETTTFKAPTGKLTVFGGSGVDTFTLTELDTAISPSLGVHFRGLGGADVITMSPSTKYIAEAHGGDPTVAVGDALDVKFTGLAGVKITHTPTSASAGSYSFDSGYKNVNYDTIEDVKKSISLLTPFDTQTGISIEPTLDWDVSATLGLLFTGAYSLELDTQADFLSGSKFEKPGLSLPTSIYSIDFDTDTFKLLNNTTYYWRIKAPLTVGGGGNVFCSGPFSFLSIQKLVPELTYPKPALTIPSTTFTFSWNVANPAPNSVYTLEIDGPVFAAPFLDTKTSTTTTFKTSNLGITLLAGNTYTWRITVKTTGGATVAISAVQTFTIAGGAVVPKPSYPIGALKVFSNDINFSWYPEADFADLTFDIEYINVTDSEVFTGTPDVSGITGLQKLITGLKPGKEYKWKVRSKHTPSAVTSAWSAEVNFFTNGPGTVVVPTPAYPTGGLQIYTTSPTLHWYLGTPETGLTFVIEYRIVGAFSFTSATSTKSQLQLTGLEPGKTYEWRVKSKNSFAEESAFSALTTFVVAGGSTQGLPTASFPINNATVYTLQPTLNWFVEGSTLGLTTFDVEWDDDALFALPFVGSKTGLTGRQYTLSAAEKLKFGTMYYWRVRAHFVNGDISDATNVKSNGTFTTTGSAGTLVPILTQPIGGLIIPDKKTTLSWYVTGSLAAVTSFDVVYSTTSTFNPSPSVTTTVTTATNKTTLDITGLVPGAKYYWKVRADNGTTKSAYSTVETFVVPAGAAPVPPITGSPVGGIALQVANPTMSWFLPTFSSSSMTYEIQYGQEADLSDAVQIDNLSSPFFEGAFLTEGTYYWRVRSATASGERSAFSEIAEFSTTASIATAVEDEIVPGDELPQSFQLLQNYPNPFNPTTTIEFTVPEARQVTLGIYNVLGQLVRTLVNDQVAPGVHRIQWDARDAGGQGVTSGLYIYRITAGDFSQARTLVLLK